MIDINEFFDLEFDSTSVTRSLIPQSAYKPIKRCPNCQSVYLTDISCEDCGRSLLYHPIGEPFSAKSLYGFKERYYSNFSKIVKYYPFFENKISSSALAYSRHLLKRFDDLLLAFGTPEAIANSSRRFFYVEMLELIDELLRYGINPSILEQRIESHLMETGSLLSQKFFEYIQDSKLENKLTKPWRVLLLDKLLMGVRVEAWLKMFVITATVVTLAVCYYEIVSLLFGK